MIFVDRLRQQHPEVLPPNEAIAVNLTQAFSDAIEALGNPAALQALIPIFRESPDFNLQHYLVIHYTFCSNVPSIFFVRARSRRLFELLFFFVWAKLVSSNCKWAFITKTETILSDFKQHQTVRRLRYKSPKLFAVCPSVTTSDHSL